ncbi:uncharacterized protein MONBRDRAFT_35576 [Monosiga brevicollis MX1]|uniref:Glutathione S-transferase n=1 Tax=Monosiga brevicollis TaxID=81824 RepID=A9UQ13_MONBE|nr:uncharacterized protein MONBRDRAFT_35576 [Monosiga brevicollis MX1]EDQ92516.1 predicted protein [Monosiga brevicollis MX1]|eukprot:XP_001742278.1 hypothetical protein [Monosiga brevicollis MX1]
MTSIKQNHGEGLVLSEQEVEQYLHKGITYFGNRVCPFAHRAWWTANETGFADRMTYVHIELMDNKPAWYQAKVNPSGTVPMLVVDGVPIFESLIVANYMNNAAGGSLWPTDPLKKSHVEAIIAKFDSKCTGALYQVVRNRDPSKDAELKASLKSAYEDLEALYTQFKADPAKPYLMGDDLSMAEIAMMPFLDRMVPTLEHYRSFNLFREAQIPNLQRAYEVASARPAFVKTRFPDAVKLMNVYANGVRAAPLPPTLIQRAAQRAPMLIAGGLVGAAAAFALLRAR